MKLKQTKAIQQYELHRQQGSWKKCSEGEFLITGSTYAITPRLPVT